MKDYKHWKSFHRLFAKGLTVGIALGAWSICERLCFSLMWGEIYSTEFIYEKELMHIFKINANKINGTIIYSDFFYASVQYVIISGLIFDFRIL